MIKLWDLLINNQPINGTYPQNVVALLHSRASTYLAIRARRAAQAVKYNNSGTHKPQTPDNELYIETARYYNTYYSDCEPKAKPPQPTVNYYYGQRTKATKHNIYLRTKYSERINNAFTDFKKINGRDPANDDEMLEYLFSLSPEYAFDKTERDIWLNIYAFFNDESGQFKAVKCSDRRTTHTENSFKGLCDFLSQNPDYSSNDRFFVSKFMKYCLQKGLNFKRSTIDKLLRYDAKRDCFSESDLNALGLNTQNQRNDFFNALTTINTLRQKK